MTDTPEIHVLDKRVRLLQVGDGFRTSLDSVMLAAACPARGGDHILDMGCGVGGAGFCVLTRVPGTCLTGVDIQSDHIDLARKNIALNDMDGRADFAVSDIRHFIAARAFDHVICNPPYMESGTHTRSPSAAKATAHGYSPHPDPLPAGEGGTRHSREGEGLSVWLDVAFRLLKSNGTLTMIHRGDKVDKIILGLKNRFGAVEIIPLWPRAGEEAKRVIVRAVKDRKTPARLHGGVILHNADGSYTDAAESILRGMQPIA